MQRSLAVGKRVSARDLPAAHVCVQSINPCFVVSRFLACWLSTCPPTQIDVMESNQYAFAITPHSCDTPQG